jgi:osmotically-inducible protein OsmY
MSEITDTIMRDIEADASIKAHTISIEVDAKGFLKRRRIIRLVGTVHSEASKEKASWIAEHHAGDNYDVVNELTIK